MKVKATAIGYYGHQRRREGDVFTIRDEPRRKLNPKKDGDVAKSIADKKGEVPFDFSSKWMVPVHEKTRERTTSSPEALRKHHDTVIAERANTGGGDAEARATGDADVI